MKIFFSDLDGTLLNSKKVITPKTADAIDTWLSNGNILALSSGRPLNSILEVIQANNLNRSGVYAIAFNGAQIYNVNEEKIISTKSLSPELAKDIINTVKMRNYYCHTYDNSHIIVSKTAPETVFYTKTIHLPVRELEHFPEDIETAPCKILCIDLNDNNTLSDFGIELEKTYKGLITCVKSNPHLLEIFPISSGKGAAVTDFCKLMNVSKKDTLASGDEQNDLSMLNEVQISIAMKNGNDILKHNATIISETDNDNDGLAQYFHTYL